MKIVTVYSTAWRQDTTGVYFDPALRALGHEVEHFEPLAWDRGRQRLEFIDYADIPKADLYLQIDDDLAYLGPVGRGVKTAYYIIDTHRADANFIPIESGMRRHHKAQGFDRLFVAQKDGVGMFPGSIWLPLAYDSSQWKPGGPKTGKIADWCFIGNINEPRERMCRELAAAFPNCFFGNAYGPAQVDLYRRSRLVLNLPVGRDVNMRFFEAAGAGGLLVSRRQGNGEEEHVPGLVTFDDATDLVDVVGKWLKDDSGRQELARKQQEHVAKHHTYVERCKALLEGM